MSPGGRPQVGTPINVRLGDELLAQVDDYAEVEGIKRAEAIRRLVQRGLRKVQAVSACDDPYPFGEVEELHQCSECGNYVGSQHFCWGSYPQ